MALKADVGMVIGLGTQSLERACPILILGEALANISRLVRFSRSLTRLSTVILVSGTAATVAVGIAAVTVL